MRKIQLAIFLLLAAAVGAVPAKPGLRPYTQADGTTVMLELHGDAFYHYYTDAEGNWMALNEQGMYERTATLSDEEIYAARMATPRQVAAATSAAGSDLNLSPRGLVILVNFSNLSFREANDHEAYEQLFNGENYNFNGAYGSVRQYFIDQSMGQYTPHFDVIGPVTVSKGQSYYGQNDMYGSDMHADEMIKEACTIADTLFGVDFAQYDNDQDGKVDFVYVIYAGQGEADGGASYTIWPHNYYLSYTGNFRLDGKRIDNYACSNELSYNSFGTLVRNSVGTPCHEFSHVCGLPDLYNTGRGNIKTLGNWDVLDLGSYNGDGIGNCPTGYSGYERFYCGWLTPTLLKTPQADTLVALQTSNEVYLISPTGEHNMDGFHPEPTTFVLLENRQKINWDRYIPGHGLLITQIQYNSRKWSSNTVNNTESDQGVDIIEADGKSAYTSSSSKGKSGDAFPYVGDYEVVDYYTPFEGYPITNITETKKVITFDFKGGNAPISSRVLEEDDVILKIYKVYSPMVVLPLEGITSPDELEPGNYILQVEKAGKKKRKFNIQLSIQE